MTYPYYRAPLPEAVEPAVFGPTPWPRGALSLRITPWLHDDFSAPFPPITDITPDSPPSRNTTPSLQTPETIVAASKDPRVRATLGPLRLLEAASPREYLVGRASDCDLVLGGKYANINSRKHCKIIWDGMRTSIIDLQSVNGTWVNRKRLSDHEARILCNNDIISFTALPLDYRAAPNSPRMMFEDGTLGQTHSLEYIYQDIRLDGPVSSHSHVRYMTGQCLNEILRVRSVLRTAREERTHVSSCTTQVCAPTRTYYGSLTRPERPDTPYYQPPLPLHMTPKMSSLARNEGYFEEGPEDPDGYPADHPDLVWQNGVRYKHVPNVHPPPWEMRLWSRFYALPVGLHMDWPIISSAPFGGQQSDIDPKRREQLFRAVYSDHPLAQSFTHSASSPYPRDSASGSGSSGTFIPGTKKPASIWWPAPLPSPEVARPSRPLPAHFDHSSQPSGASSGYNLITQALKRSYTDDHLSDERPAKRVALSSETDKNDNTASIYFHNLLLAARPAAAWTAPREYAPRPLFSRESLLYGPGARSRDGPVSMRPSHSSAASTDGGRAESRPRRQELKRKRGPEAGDEEDDRRRPEKRLRF